MDPDKLLENLIDMAKHDILAIDADIDNGNDGTIYTDAEEASDRIYEYAERVLAIDAWLKDGSFTPARWAKKETQTS